MGEYQFPSRIRYSECGEDCRLHLVGAVNYFQDAATFQGEDLRIGIPWMKERHLAWILVFWQIISDHMPRLGEQVTVRTWPYSFNSFYGLRNLVLEDGQGKKAVWANSVWVLMDTQNQRPVKVPEEMIERYGLAEKLEMDYAPRRIRFPTAAVRWILSRSTGGIWIPIITSTMASIFRWRRIICPEVSGLAIPELNIRSRHFWEK